MKKLILFSVCLSVLFIFTSCKEECGSDSNPICTETVPTDEACLAFFERWFFDSNSNACQKVGYSGCSQKGFETKDECESCKCN